MNENVVEAWDKEILRRLAQVDAGQAKLLTLDVLHAEIQSAVQPLRDSQVRPPPSKP